MGPGTRAGGRAGAPRRGRGCRPAGGGGAGKSAAGCPGHRIIVVKYSWAFGLDAISEQCKPEECGSLGKKPTGMTRPPPHPAPASPADPRTPVTCTPTLHALSHTFPQSGATERMQARHHPRVPQTGRCTPSTDMQAQQLKQDPRADHPQRSHTHRHPSLASPNPPDAQPGASLSNPHQSSDGENEAQRGEGTCPRLPSMETNDAPSPPAFRGCTPTLHSPVCLTPGLNAVNSTPV